MVLVIIGVTLIGSSLLQTWIPGKNADPWSALMGGIGVGSFVIVFFNKPQSNINMAVASLASIYMLYKGHKMEYEAIYSFYCSIYEDLFADEHTDGRGDGKYFSDLVKMNNELERSTQFYVNLVHSHLKVFNGKSKEDGKSKKPAVTSQLPKDKTSHDNPP